LLNAAGEGAPAKLAQGKTDANGAFKLSFGPAPKGSVLYLVAKGGAPKVAEAKGPNDAIALLAVLGSSPPKKVMVNEFTTIASVWTSAQFLKGDVLSGKSLGLNIASGNVPNFVNLETGGYGGAIQDALNSAQTPTMANFATLANVLAGCVTLVTPDACSRFFAAATDPAGNVPTDTLMALEMIAQNPWHEPAKVFELLVAFYPVPQGKFLRPTPFQPYLSFPPSAWVLPLKFTGGGLRAPGKLMIDGQGNCWAADNFLVGAQNQSILWSGNLSKLAPNGRPLSPMTSGFTGGGLMGPGFGLTLDAADNVWVSSFTGAGISKFDNSGKPLSPPEGYTFNGQLGKMQGIIATPNGDIWAVDATKMQVVRFPKGDTTKGELLMRNPTDDPLSNPYKLMAPFHLAIDRQDRIWVSNAAGDWVTRFAATDPTKVETFKVGFSPSGLAIDSKGNVWVSNRLGSSERGRLKLYEMLAAFKVNFDGDSDPADRLTKVLIPAMAAQTSGYWEGGSVSVLSPNGAQASFSPVSGRGLTGPWAVAVDGDDHVWISNFSTSSAGIVELCGFQTDKNPPGMKPGDAISPPGGYVGGGLQMQVDIDIDSAGNVWVSNNWQDYPAALRPAVEPLSTLGAGQGVVVFYGMAKPVRTPLIGPPREP
jgi:streptogramin lyase